MILPLSIISCRTETLASQVEDTLELHGFDTDWSGSTIVLSSAHPDEVQKVLDSYGIKAVVRHSGFLAREEGTL